MKHFLFIILIVATSFCSAQKYALVDKKMSQPVTYKDIVTVQDNFNGFFAIEKSKLPEFISEIEKISNLLAKPKSKKPEKLDFNVGSTAFHGLRVALTSEDRMDIVLTTNLNTSKTSMHLSDAKISNANNAFFINTWLKYLHSYIK